MRSAPVWMSYVLYAAAAWNLGCGLMLLAAPAMVFTFVGMAVPQPEAIVRGLGMIIVLLGIGYIIAAQDPRRHWAVVLIGLLGKVVGPVGAIAAAINGDFTWSMAATSIPSDIIWWIPLGLILKHAWTAPQPASLKGLDHIAIVAEKLAETAQWYRQRFGCQTLYEDDTWAMLDFGNTKLALVVPHQHPAHLGIVADDAERWGNLKTHRDRTRSIYTADPSGNVVEILSPILAETAPARPAEPASQPR